MSARPPRRAFAAGGRARARSGAASGATAQPNTAMLRYENGSRLYSMHRYVEAAHEFEAAYALSRQAALLFNLGRAWEDAGETSQALDAYARFEAAGAPGYDLAQLRERIARLRGQLSATRTLPPPVAPRAARVAPPPPRTPPPSGAPVGPIVLLSIGGAALVAAVPLWFSARSTYDDLRAICSSGSCPSVFEGDARRGERFALAGDVLLGVGAASLVAGVTWLLIDRHPTARAEAPRVTFGCGPGGCALGVGGRF